jgi:periplasmic protein CpxP/Spy
MKLTARLSSGLIALAILTLSPAAQASRDLPEPPPPRAHPAPLPPPAMPGPPDGMPHGMVILPPPPPFLHRLELDEAQQDQVFALLHAQAPKQRVAAKAAAAALAELRKLSTSSRYDATRAKQLAAAHGQAIAELVLLHADTDVKLRALLTPEQRAKLDEVPAKPAETRR